MHRAPRTPRTPRTATTALAAAVLLLLGAVCVAEAADQEARKWWETAVVYQIYPRSYMDSDGDGVGDLPGITSKLEYLKELGIAALWLSPIYPSPQKDFGYDISNFTDIDPQYGTLDDFRTLLKTAHGLGLRVVLDFVPNHSSDQHEWFIKSVEDPNGKYGDYYVWHDGKKAENGTRLPPNNWLQSFRGTAWEWNEKRQQYYLHQFVKEQPDLNYRCQGVVDDMKDAIRFWMEMGVDGIRVDTIPNLFEDDRFLDEPRNEGQNDPEDPGYLEHIYTQNRPETYDMAKQWHKVLAEFDGDRIMMTEAYATLEQTQGYYGTEEEPGATFSFNFFMITNLSSSSNAQDFKDTIDNWMSFMYPFRKPNWVIGNHDQHRVGSFFRYGPELDDGINMISMLLPGTAITYNGEEIGMEDTFITWEQSKDPQAVRAGSDNYLAKSRDLCRTPFQWDATSNAGFSTAKETWLPVNPNYWRVNVKAQQEAEHSHYKMYRALVEARKTPAVQSRNYEVKVFGDALVITRAVEGEDAFIVVVNPSSVEARVELAELWSLDEPLQVWTSSLNSQLRPGNTVKSALSLRPKEGLVLTTGTGPVPYPSSGGSSTSAGVVSRAAALLSLAAPLVCLLLVW